MRKAYEEILKTTFRRHVICSRKEMNMTQAEMSELLEMAERSYNDLERGKFSCSALTLSLYLIYCCDDVTKFLDELKDSFEKAVEDVA